MGVFIEHQALPSILFSQFILFSFSPLRYEASTNELINEELGIAYPIIDGIPNMIPQATRMTHENNKKKWSSTRSYVKATTLGVPGWLS